MDPVEAPAEAIAEVMRRLSTQSSIGSDCEARRPPRLLLEARQQQALPLRSAVDRTYLANGIGGSSSETDGIGEWRAAIITRPVPRHCGPDSISNPQIIGDF
jgi:hypothetical protein